MVPLVEQHVDESAFDLERSAKRARVIALAENAATSAVNAIDGLGDANCEALNPARQRAAVIGFDDQMYVVALHRIVRQRHPETVASFDECAANTSEELAASQRWYAFSHVQRDV
jgi:hypothetical protein